MPSADAVVLPANVIPVKYRMTLQPDLGTFTFRGEQTVDIDIQTPTARIVLNAAELEINDVTLRSAGTTIAAHSIALNEDSETVTLDFGMTLSQGPAQLEMRFTGLLNDRLVGFYRSKYQDGEGADAAPGHHPVRGHRCPPGFPMLGRAGAEGSVRCHPGV